VEKAAQWADAREDIKMPYKRKTKTAKQMSKKKKPKRKYQLRGEKVTLKKRRGY
jgi:hypothetical protein